MNHKHYTFNKVDNLKKDQIPKGDALPVYLRAIMYHHVALNKSKMIGDEFQYIDMLAKEFSVDGVSPN